VRTVYLGTSEFAASVLDALAASAHRPVLVVSRPDRPRGRGRHLASPPVAERARALGLALIQPESVNSEQARGEIAAVKPEIVVVCAFGALIKEPLLSEHRILNVHPSLLPRWRGAAPIERALEAGDERTGVCIMALTAGLDSGPVCMRHVEQIRPEDDYGRLAERLASAGGRLLVEALDRLAAGQELPFQEQEEDGVTYAEKIAPADRLLEEEDSPAVAERRVRALHPHIGARIDLGGGAFLGVERARAVQGRPPRRGLHAAQGRLYFGLREGNLELLSVKPPGGRSMSGADYVRGRALPTA
jgi:methionyl-tRNA formyltransferase